MKELTIIIVTYNSAEIIEKSLSNLNAQKYDIAVVDNASLDNCAAIIAKKFPQIKLIKSDKNIGYGRANNIVLRQVETEFALILNPDALIEEKDIDLCLETMKRNKNVALASTIIHNDETALAKKMDEIDQEYHDVNLVFGGVMFMRMEIFQKIGFFDEEFFMFAEDNELSDRAIKNGYKNIIVNNAHAVHIGGSSSKKTIKNTYRRFWHLGWSKSKYKTRRKNKFNFIRSSLRLVIIYFCEAIFYFFTGNLNKAAGKIGFSLGCFSCLIGIKAFKKDGNPTV